MFGARQQAHVQVAVAVAGVGVVGRPRIKRVVGLMFDDVLAGMYAAIVLAIAA